jgi:anti-anti-sigma factor
MTSGPALEIVTEHEGSRSVVRLRGELDLSTDNDVRREIGAVLHSHNPKILLLDLSGLTFTDSTGLGTMVWAHKQLTERGHQLWIAGPNPLLLRLLRITGLDKQLQLVSGAGAAENSPEAAEKTTG